jgi:predicted nucleic acid-binding protein
MIPRVVVDTNVLIRAVLGKGGGDSREVLRRCLKGRARPLLGVALFTEYEDVFGRADVMKKCPPDAQGAAGIAGSLPVRL